MKIAEIGFYGLPQVAMVLTLACGSSLGGSGTQRARDDTSNTNAADGAPTSDALADDSTSEAETADVLPASGSTETADVAPTQTDAVAVNPNEERPTGPLPIAENQDADDFEPPPIDPFAVDFYNQWKVQLQQVSGGSYSDLKGPEDEDGQSQFLHDSAYGLLTFLLDESYVTTESTKSRSELRERDGNGRDFGWTQRGSHTLVASVQVVGDELHDEERDIIVLQAHTSDNFGPDPFDDGVSDSFGTGIYWRPGSSKFECKIRDPSGDDAAHDLLTDVSSSELENFHTFRIQVEDGRSRCGYLDGSDWQDSDYEELIGGLVYFKAGNYTQESNRDGGSGDRTAVVLRDIVVTHP